MIVIEPCAGLGNRLLGLGSAHEVAEKLNRELIVIWKREVGCNARASDLFDLPMAVEEISENGMRREPIAHLKGSRVKVRYRKGASKVLSCDDVERIREERGFGGLFDAIAAEPSIYIKAFGPICPVSTRTYSFLKPSAAIEEKGRELFDRIDGATVGVHVRRTDHADAIANSPLSLFAERMREELWRGASGFFVATDDASVRDALRESLPGVRLEFHEKGVIDRDSKEGVEDAFIEMLALSRCRKILGSYNSTFSLLPSYMGGIPLEVVRREGA